NADVNADDEAGARYGVNDIIEFNIDGDGVQTIDLTGTLDIQKPVTIKGFTQGSGVFGGAGPNIGAFGFPIDATELIVLKNNAAMGNTVGITISANDSTVKGLVIQGFEDGIDISGDNNKVQGCFIGTDDTGNAAAPNGCGIDIKGGTGNLIGGPNTEDRN